MLLCNEFLHYSFLYSTNIAFNNVFRLVIRLKTEVDYDALKRASKTAFKRYPYFCVKLVKKGDCYDVVFNDRDVKVIHSSSPIVLGTEEANCHFVSIGCSGKAIYIDVYHSLTDASGITPLSKTLMYYYHYETTGKYPEKRDILTLDDIVTEKETSDPVSYIKEYPEKADYEYHEIKAFNLGTKDENTLDQRKLYLVKIPEETFMTYVKEHKGSVNTTIASLFAKAVDRCSFEEKEKIVAGIAMSTKRLIRAEKSYANMVALANIEFPEMIENLSIEELNREARIDLSEQTKEQNILYSIKKRPNLVAYLKALPDDDSRKDVYYKMILRMKARDTFFVSYLGKQDWSSLEDDIDSIFVISEADNHSMEINLYAVGGNFCIAMAQNFGLKDYMESFLSLLSGEGIPYSVEDPVDLSLPLVRTTELFVQKE